MFIILVYDVNIKRVAKVNKICNKYLRPIQKSVFEGDITEKKFRMLQDELKRFIDTSVDSICLYQLESMKYTYKIQIGPNDNTDNILWKRDEYENYSRDKWYF